MPNDIFPNRCSAERYFPESSKSRISLVRIAVQPNVIFPKYNLPERHFLEIGVGAKTLNDKKSEWPKSLNSKLSKFKCREAIITNDFEVLNKNLRTQRCRKKFKSKANIRILKITKGEITKGE